MLNRVRYLSSDIWLLISIIAANKHEGSNVHNIIAYGDAINKAIFTAQEFETGIKHLFQGGLIRRASDNYVPTKQALELYDAESASQKSYFEIWEKIESKIATSDVRPKDISSESLFDKKEFDQAVTNYCKVKKPIK